MLELLVTPIQVMRDSTCEASKAVDIKPFQRVLIPTCLAIALPDGYVGFVQPRSAWRLSKA